MDLNCRVCLQVREIMVDLFENVDQFQTTLACLLEDCGGIKVERSDFYPKYLCQLCAQELLAVNDFRIKCQKATKLLLEMDDVTGEMDDSLVEYTSGGEVISPNTSIDGEDFYDTSDQVIRENSETENPCQPKNSNLNVMFLDVQTDGSGTENSSYDLFDVIIEESNSVGESKIERGSNETAENITTRANNSQVIYFADKEDESINENNSQNPITEENTLTTTTSQPTSKEIIECIIEELNSEKPKLDDYVKEQEQGGPPISMPITYMENHKFICEMCGASFVKSINLRKHLEAEHLMKLDFFCENCNKKFESQFDLKRHEEICCPVVMKTTADDSTKLNQTTCSKYACDHCGKCVQSLFALRMHERTHTGERPFSCDTCQSQFKTQSALTEHKKRHTNDADFICEICDKRFYSYSNLVVHRRIHTGHKPHTCKLCFKSFARVYLLQLHMRVHTGKRPYKCEYCGKKFAQNSACKYHSATHRDERKYSCNICSKSFIKKSQLIIHMEKHMTRPVNEIEEIEGREEIENQ